MNENYHPEQKEKRKGPSWIFCIILALITAIIGGLAGAGFIGVFVTHYLQGKTSVETEALRTEVSALREELDEMTANAPSAETTLIQASQADVSTEVTRVVEEVGPAVVTITAVIPGQMTFWGLTGDSTSLGSGVIISSDGYILTNNHVISNGKAFSVELANGTVLEAELVSADSFSDLAILKVDGEMPAVAKLGNSDMLKAGETVIAIGSPLGNLDRKSVV